MPRTKVVNQTGSSISLKEGTAGVLRTLCDNLQHGSSYTIKVDQIATYREYWCAVTPDDDKHVVLSSDDCMEHEEVRIELQDGSYTWVPVKRRSHKMASKQRPTQASEGTEGAANPREPGGVGKAWSSVKGWFS